MLPQYGGIINGVDQGNLLWVVSGKNCGISKDTIFSGTNVANAIVTYKYAITWHYSNNCQGQVSSTLDGKINYEGANYAGEVSLIANAQVFPAAKAPLINVTSSSVALTGMQRVKGQANAAFNTVISFENVNLTTDPIAKKIISGTANVLISSTGATGFSFKGTVQFISYNKAKITLNSGTVYPISW